MFRRSCERSLINDDFFSQLVEGRQLTDICDHVRAKCRVDISPESPNTHDNAKAMREREVFFDGKTIVCEFHSKLTLTHDRIHFSPSLISDKNDNKFLIVGPFADHLTT